MSDRATPARRRWPRLSVRTLLGLVLVAGLVLGWWMRSVRNQQQAVATIRAFGDHGVCYDDEAYPEKPIDRLPTWFKVPVSWLDARLPKDYFHSVVAVRALFSQSPGERTASSIEMMAAVRSLTHLEDAKLDLPVRDADLVGLEHLNRLKWLTIYQASPELTDAGLASIAGAVAMEQLWLPDCAATDEGLARLGALTQLERFWIGDNAEIILGRSRLRATGSGLAGLASLTRLRDLDLRSSRLTHEGVARIGSLRHLNSLRLAGPVTPSDLPVLASLPELTSLNLCCTDLNGRGLETLRRLPKLEILQFFHEFIDDSAVPALAEFRQLKHLDLIDTEMTPAGIASLRGLLPNLGIGKMVTPFPGRPTRPRPKARPPGPTPSPAH